MSRRVTLTITANITVDLDEGVPMQDVIDNVDISLPSFHHRGDLVNYEISQWELIANSSGNNLHCIYHNYM